MVKFMSRILVVCVSVLILSVSAFAQGEIKPCPAIQTASPTTVTMPGETITFSVKVGTESENSKLKYDWIVSAGTIIEGQGTSIIKVATTPEMSGETVTSKVKIEGLPENCSNEASESAGLESICSCCGVAFEDYGKTPAEEEKARLDNMFTFLLSNPEAIAYFRIVIERDETTEQTKKRIKKIVDHTNFRKFDEKRLVFAIDKSGTYGDEQRTLIHLIPKNEKFPECENCEIIRGEDVK